MTVTPPIEDWTLVEIRATLRYNPGGAPIVGYLRFTPTALRSVSVTDQAQIAIATGRRFVIGADGDWSAKLPATDDPAIIGEGGTHFVYLVEEEFPGGSSYHVSVPAAKAATGVTLGEIAGAQPGIVPGVSREDLAAAVAEARRITGIDTIEDALDDLLPDRVTDEVAQTLADPEVTTVVTTAVDARLAQVSPIGALTLDGGYLDLPGTGSYASTPDAPDLDLTGDLDIRIYGTPTALAAAAFRTLVAKRGANTAYELRLALNGGPQLVHSANGAALTITGSSAAPVLWNGLHITRRESDGRVQFFILDPAGAVVRADGSRWTQHGTDRVGLVGALFNSSGPLSVGALGTNGTTAFVGKALRAEVRTGIDGPLVASPDFRGRGAERSFTDAQGHTWALTGAAAFVAPTASASKTGTMIALETTQGSAKRIVDYRGVPYKDPHSGLYNPRGFNRALATPEATTLAFQTAIDAANADSGGAIAPTETYTFAPSTAPGMGYAAALFLRDNVGIIGPHWQAAKLLLAPGANCMMVSGRGVVDGNGLEDYTSNVTLAGFTLDGNKAAQTNGATRTDLHALHLRRFNGLRLGDLRVQHVAGRGLMTTGGAGVGTPGTRLVRPMWQRALSFLQTNGCGYYAGGTHRQLHNLGIHVEQCGQAGGEPGAFFDHSEDLSSSFVAFNCPGDGAYYHNVQMSQYLDHRAIANGGYGMLFKSVVNSTVRDIKAWGNCHAFGAAAATATLDGVAYRSEFTESAEIVIGNGGGYGPTKNTVFDGIHAPGDKAFGGNNADNRFADYSVIIDAGVDPGIELEHFYPGDGGLAVGPDLLDLRPVA